MSASLLVHRLTVAISIAVVALLPVEGFFQSTQAASAPNDPRFGEQWGLQRINAQTAWDTTTGSASVVVAVVDTGVDLGHPDLQGHLVDGHNFVREDRPPQDDNGHGTHVAGTIAASLNNNIGIAGVAPSVLIMPVKVFGRTGRGTDESVAAGVYWAVDHGAWVVNMSFGPASSGTQPTPLVEEAIQYANGLGAVVVLAAGNRGASEPPTLSESPGVISVAATMPNDARAPFSNHGPWVHLGAPGTGILSTFFDGTSTYRAESGTSVAAPYVSGVAALLLSVRPWLKPADVDRILRTTADSLPGQDVGAGRLNAGRAVAAAKEMPIAGPAPIGSPDPAPGTAEVSTALTTASAPDPGAAEAAP
jgi:thermitase